MQKFEIESSKQAVARWKRLVFAFSIASLVAGFSPAASAHVISPEDHHAFEHKYAEVCVKKELALRKKENRSSGSAGYVDEALQKICDCIAQEQSKNLTKDEVKKFLREGKYPMSLMIKAGQAEETCAKK